MRRLFLAVLTLCLTAVAANAQEPGKAFSFMPMPSATNAHSMLRLLRRAEVITHLSLSLYQQKAIKDLAEDPNSGRLRVSITSTGSFDPEQAKQDAERQIAEQQKGLLDKIKDILKPDQYSRSQELMIQWRGPMILADSKLAESARLSGSHRQEIAKLTGEYQRQKMEIMMELAETQEDGDAASGHIRRAVKIDSSKLEKIGTPAYNKLNALKKEVDEKILALLTADEKKAFEKVQGESFTFRKEPVGDRF